MTPRWTVARQALLSMGFLRQEYWSGLPFSSPGDLPDPRIKTMSPALAGGFFTTEPIGKTQPPSLPAGRAPPGPLYSQLPLGCVMVVGWEPQDSPEHGHTCRQARALSERGKSCLQTDISRRSSRLSLLSGWALSPPCTPTAAPEMLTPP